MGTIPLITSLTDPRNLATVAAYAILGRLVLYAIVSEGRRAQAIIMVMTGEYIVSILVHQLLVFILHQDSQSRKNWYFSRSGNYIFVQRNMKIWHTKNQGILFLGKLKAFEKANLAKLVIQVSEKEGEPEPVWNQAVPFFTNQDFKDCLWSRAILDFLWSWASACPVWDWTQTYNRLLYE